MSKPVSNVDIITDSWENALLLLNSLLYSMSTEIITANTTYANTGNNSVSRTAQLWGTFGANNLVVTNGVRGGNVTGQFANLVITTNVNVSNASASNLNVLVGNSSTFSYTTPNGGYYGNTAANAVVNTSSIIIQSNSTVNTNITSGTIKIANSTTSANIDAGSFRTGAWLANTTAMAIGANVVANGSVITITGTDTAAILTNTHIKFGNSTVNSTANATTLAIGNSTTNSALTSSQLSVANSSLTNNILNIANEYKVELTSNTNIGAGTGSPIRVYSFPKADWSSGKFEVQIKNTGNTQITELVMAHDGTDAYVAIYGTVASPAAGNNSISPLGTFSANVNNANVDLLLTQTSSSSAVKVVAHLIK